MVTTANDLYYGLLLTIRRWEKLRKNNLGSFCMTTVAELPCNLTRCVSCIYCFRAIDCFNVKGSNSVVIGINVYLHSLQPFDETVNFWRILFVAVHALGVIRIHHLQSNRSRFMIQISKEEIFPLFLCQ